MNSSGGMPPLVWIRDTDEAFLLANVMHGKWDFPNDVTKVRPINPKTGKEGRERDVKISEAQEFDPSHLEVSPHPSGLPDDPCNLTTSPLFAGCGGCLLDK